MYVDTWVHIYILGVKDAYSVNRGELWNGNSVGREVEFLHMNKEP